MQTDTVAFIRLSRAPPQESPVKTLVGLQSWNAGTVELGNSSSDPVEEKTINTLTETVQQGIKETADKGSDSSHDINDG